VCGDEGVGSERVLGVRDGSLGDRDMALVVGTSRMALQVTGRRKRQGSPAQVGALGL
jgi:hypothetical protein